MENNYIDSIEKTPTLHSKKCTLIAFSIQFFLQYALFIISFVVWYLYDYFIAGATLLIGFLVIGILRAKLRNEVIPLHQREYHYTDKEIAYWLSAKKICQEFNQALNE